jgi:exosortase J
VVTGAILLGYFFNLLRLCLLVLYYLVALRITSLQNKAENADYLIGAALFLVATIFLFTVIHRLRDGREENEAQVVIGQEPSKPLAAPSSRYAQLAVMATVAFFGCVGLAKAKVASSLAIAKSTGAERQQFPKRLGPYVLERTWDETLVTGAVVYSWAEYLPHGGGTAVAIGFSPVLGWHDPLVCHTIRGEKPLWIGNVRVTTGDSIPVSFTSAFYNDGVTQSLEASTQCSGESCNEFVTDRTHFGFVYSRIHPTDFMGEDTHRSVPVLIRVETLNTSLPTDAARQLLTQSLRAFLGSVSLDDLIRSSGQQR